MLRTILLIMLLTAVVGTAVYKLREVPTIGRFLMSDADPLALGHDWPPVVGRQYPDFQLIDQNGQPTRLSEFRGKIVLVEFIGIPCGACQAFAGAHKVGAFRGGKVQTQLKSIEQCAQTYGRFDLNDEDVVLVQVILFDEAIRAPSPDDARAWAKHFGMDRSQNKIVLAGTPQLATRQSYDMIPGFQLIDRNGKLLRDSTGHQPAHDLYRDLLPTMGRMVAGHP